MHEEILGIKEGYIIDHRNRNGLINRRNNLRHVTYGQNHQNIGIQRNNKSGYKGVTFFRRTGRWAANIGHNKKRYTLGTYKTKEEAAIAYRDAAIRLGFIEIPPLP
jgi:hypothetical protein